MVTVQGGCPRERPSMSQPCAVVAPLTFAPLCPRRMRGTFFSEQPDRAGKPPGCDQGGHMEGAG
eukprot:1299599-Lingulodinium_polyedra.AAC.1